MAIRPAPGYIDQPAAHLISPLISVRSITTGPGAAGGTTIVDTSLIGQPSYVGGLLVLFDGPAAGQFRSIISHVLATGVLIVDEPFTDSTGAAVQIVGSTTYLIVPQSNGQRPLYYGTTTGAGLPDGSSLVDTGLATPFTQDDEPIGATVQILTSATATLVGQRREIYDYDFGATVLFFNILFNSQVPVGTTYVVWADRPSGGGGPGPQPEPAAEETNWELTDFDPFDVADASADTERWSSEYVSAGAADGAADINTTTPSRLYLNITAAALAAAEYGVRRRQTFLGRTWFHLADFALAVVNPNVTDVWAGLSVSEGIAWNAANYIRIYKRQRSAVAPLQAITVERNIAGGGVVTTDILTTTQTEVAFKIERIGNIWRCYYSLTQGPRHHWQLAAEIEDPTNAMTDVVTGYISVRNPEDAVGQRITANVNAWEYYQTLGALETIISLISSRGGALAYLGYCSPVMAASTTAVVCPNLAGFGDDLFNYNYQMVVLRNSNALNTAPQMERRNITDYVSATGGFTAEAFSAVVEANDIVLVVQNSVAAQIPVFGIADAGSGVAIVRDAARTEADDWWNGQTVVMLSGAARGQKRPISDFLAATDDIIPAPAFDAAVAAGDLYAILAHYNAIVPRAADSVANALTSDVVGRKDDTPDYTRAATQSSIIRLIKGVLGSLVIAEGTFTLSSATAPADAARGEANEYFRGAVLMPVAGAVAFQPRGIVHFTNAGGVFSDLSEPFTAAPGLVDYIVIGFYNFNLLPAADSALNQHVGQVVGSKIDTATPDDMSILTSVSLVRLVKRVLMRLSTDAFAATTQGNARVELDLMLGDLATYFVAAGAAMALQVNGNAARTNLQQALSDFFAAFGCDGANVFNPTVQGAARTDLDAALAALSTYFSAAGAAWSVQINGNLARTNLEQVWEDFSAVFGVDGVNVFNPTVQGAARTDLDAAIAALATYMAAAGAALSIQVNGLAARDNLEQVLEDYFAVVGVDGANVFNPTIQGAARLTFEAAWNAMATYISPAGAAYSATVDPGGAARTTIEETLEDLGQIIAGAAGLTTFPAALQAANGVSLAEVLRWVQERADDIYALKLADLTLTETGGQVTAPDIIGTEIVVWEDNSLLVHDPRVVMIDLDNMLAGDTTIIRVYYRMTNGGALKLQDYNSYVGADGGLANGVRLIAVGLLPNRLGVRVTLAQSAGVVRAYDWWRTAEN